MPSQVAALPVSVTPSSIVEAKLHQPRSAGQLVQLLRAQKRLTQDVDRPFTLVAAPAGFGKTTLLCEWLRTTPRPSAWLSLDEHDNELSTFLAYLIAAIRTVRPDACPALHGLLQAPVLPQLTVLRSLLNNEIDRLADADGWVDGQRFILVLDDYHHVTNQDIHSLIDDLLRHPPRPLHLVVSARYDPPFALSTLRAQGQLVEIRSGMLRFTQAEIATFLQQALHVPISPEVVDLVEQRTEGWAAGLRFAALALNAFGDNAQNVIDILTNDRLVMEYLLGEVIMRLPASMQTFLVQTSLLERLNASLCDAILGEYASGAYSQPMLEWLEQEGIFTVSLDNRGEWYRYHTLFRHFLSNQLVRRYSLEQIAGLHRRASDWFVANGFVEDALHHALAAGDTIRVAQIIEAHRHQALNFSQFQRLEQWLKLAPPSLIEARPALLIIEAWLLAERWRTPDMSALLDRIEALLPESTLSPPERTILESEIAALRADYCYFIGDRAGLLRFSQRALEIAPLALSAVRRFAWLNYLAALQLHGDFKAMQEALHTSLREGRNHGDAFPVSPLITHCAASWMNADLATTEQSALHLLRLTQERNLFNEQGWAYFYLGCVAYQRNDLEGAHQAFTTIVSQPYHAHGHVFWQGAFGLAAVYCAQGEGEQAQALSDSLFATAWEMGGAHVLEEARTLQAFVALHRGHQAIAQAWAAAYDRSQPVAPMSMFYAAPQVLARILLDSGASRDLASAEAWISHMNELSRTMYNTRVQIEMLALQAILHELRGKRAAALSALAQALYLAEPGGLVRVFIDLGAPMAFLLAELARQSVAPTFARRVLQGWTSTPAADAPLAHASPRVAALPGDIDASQHNVFVEPLTRREAEVLELLAQRLTTPEIAERLVISENTVKRHRANIYQKLGVSSRRDALAVACKVHLITQQ